MSKEQDTALNQAETLKQKAEELLNISKQNKDLLLKINESFDRIDERLRTLKNSMNKSQN